ncbi:MAG: PAS domain S-box protein, partial [Anaerolineales bacterium]|nr:PAS domain S-box protein [Anaerolineales bacterium]
MKDKDKTKQQLVDELGELRQQIAELEASEADRRQAEDALDGEADRSAFNLNILLLATFVVMLLGIIAMLAQIGKRPLSYMLPNTMFLLFAALLLALCYYLSRQGHVRAGSIIFTVMMTIMCGGAIIVGGTRGALPVILIIPVVSASITLGTNSSLALAAWSVVALVTMGLLERNGVIKVPYPAPEVMALLNMFDVGFSLFFVTLGVWLAGYSLRQSLERARKEIIERKRAEEALRESEELYRNLVETSPTAIVTGDIRGDLLFVNSCLAKMHGYENADQLLGEIRNIRELVSPESRALLEKEFKSVLESGYSQTREYMLPKKRGEKFPAMVSATAIRDTEGKPSGFLAIALDITERRQAEEALRESEEKYRTLVEQSLQGLVIVQDLRIVFANTAFAEISGYSVEELLSLAPEDVVARIHSEDQALVWGYFRDRMVGKPVPLRYEYRGIRRDGTVCWLEMSANRIEYRGKPAVQAAIVDITERKQAEEERERLLAQIREQAQRMQQILDTVPEGVLLLDADERIILVNPVAEGELVFLADAKVGGTLIHLGDRPLAELLTSPPRGLWHEV